MMITVYGTPAAKGSMKCIGTVGGRHHQLVEQNAKKIKPWRDLITLAGKKAVSKHGPLTGPIIVEATFTVPRPTSVPLAKREWPTSRSAGDSDKLLRLVLDALDGAGLYDDDSLIVTATSSKAYPDTPGAADRLDRPGAIIRIEAIM